MGKVEKIVVLSVAFLIVVILAISTQGGGSVDPVQAATGGNDEGVTAGTGAALQAPEGVDEGSETPGDDVSGRVAPADRTLGEALRPPAPDPDRAPGVRSPGERVADESTSAGERSPLQSNTSVVPTEPVYEVPTEIPAEWDLVTLAGLADHLFDPSLKVYTAQRNDTFLKIARRYYGDDAYVAALERNNEGLDTIDPGHQLLLPVRAREILAEPADRYVVQDGESLWKIAKKVYGAGHRWGEIYEANRGVLSSPDAVTPGTALRIP